jgi:phage terminase large subunit-like protein
MPTVYIESNASLFIVVKALKEENMKRSAYAGIKEIQSQKDKGIRLGEVSGVFEQGMIYFANGQKSHAELIDQLISFPRSKHDDLVDAIVHAINSFKRDYVIDFPDDYSKMVSIKKNSFDMGEPKDYDTMETLNLKYSDIY